MKKLISLLLVTAVLLSALTLPVFGKAGTCDADRWIVDYIGIEVDQPVIGGYISEGFTLDPACEGFYVADVSWSPQDTSFRAEVAYTVTITVEAETGFTFNLTDDRIFWINTGVATILSRSADQIKACYTFEPLLPDFIEVGYDYSAVSIGLHENFTLSAKYTLPEGATNVKHQWYVASSAQAWGTAIEGATSKTLAVPSDTEGTKYYRCHVTCTVGGEYLSTRTEEFATVKVTVKAGGVPSMFFDDVRVGDWFYGDVEYVYYNRLMNGIGDNRFGPNLPTTRGMIVTILHRMEGKSSGVGACPFTDVAPGSYYREAITWAAEKGIVNGVGGSSFAPDANITREQFAAIFFRYAVYKGWYNEDDCVMTAGFCDVDRVSSWAEEPISWAVGVGLLNGMNGSDGLYLRPQGNATRCQAAAIIHRFCEYFMK